MLTPLNSALKNTERINPNRAVDRMEFLISPWTKIKVLKQKHCDQDSTNVYSPHCHQLPESLTKWQLLHGYQILSQDPVHSSEYF